MFRIIITILLFWPATGFSQLYINKTKNQVKKELGKISGKENSITETDSTLILKVRGRNSIESDHIYRFDKSGKCSSEKTITWCDSCHEKLFQPLLANKKYNWKKINMNQYVADFSFGIFVEIQMTDTIHSFTIFRSNLSREMYKFLLETNN